MHRLITALPLAIVVAASASADVVTLTTYKDNTLIEDPTGGFSAGASPNFFVGRTGTNAEGTKRRGVIAFDVAGAVPLGSTITAATLKLHMSQTTSGNQSIVLKRLLAPWGEGTSFAFGGAGAPSTPGDATWIHQYFSNDPWDTTGGVFSTTVSATKTVGGEGFYTWGSTAGMVADVQSWLNTPATNYGWLVQGNEAALKTTKRFESRESTTVEWRPVLTITFTPPPP